MHNYFFILGVNDTVIRGRIPRLGGVLPGRRPQARAGVRIYPATVGSRGEEGWIASGTWTVCSVPYVNTLLQYSYTTNPQVSEWRVTYVDTVFVGYCYHLDLSKAWTWRAVDPEPGL